jgi:hypothetical protein
MAQDLVTDAHLAAGRDYLVALRAHGVDPEGMCWMTVPGRDEPQLALITSLVDRVGPGDIQAVLFKAYDGALTPRSIDPWIVSLFSPSTAFALGLRRAMLMLHAADAQEPVRPGLHIEVVWHVGGAEVRQSWVHVWPIAKPKPTEQLRGWRRFVADVERVAA